MVVVAKVHMQFQYPYLTRIFIWKYHCNLGLCRSQGLDFDHAFSDLNVVVQMGQKRGKLPGFDHRLNQENRSAGRDNNGIWSLCVTFFKLKCDRVGIYDRKVK